jgi:hypothetical protein
MRNTTRAISIKIAHSTAAQIKRWRDHGINVTTAVIACIRYGLSVRKPLELKCGRWKLVQIGLRLPENLLAGVDELAEQWSMSRSEVIDIMIQHTISDSIAGVSAQLTVFLPTITTLPQKR